MGRPKYYRFNIKQQINSLQYKTKYFYLKNINISRYGLCLAEAELLADIANNYYQPQLLKIPENHFIIKVYENNQSQKKRNLSQIPRKNITIPAFSAYELDIYQDYGLKALQNYRILNMLDAVAFQRATIDINLLAKLVNITPKSIRNRMTSFLKSGIRLPLIFLSSKYSTKNSVFRRTKAIKDFFIHQLNENEIMKNLLLPKNEWSFLLFNFYQFCYDQKGLFNLPSVLVDELNIFKEQILKSSRYLEFSLLYPKMTFRNVLKYYFCFSEALISDYLNFLQQEANKTNDNRKHGEIIYYAVGEQTISGTRLIHADFIPIKISIFTEDDKQPDSAYETSTRKWNKACRYSIQAKNQHANLSQYDLAFLLGISLSVIKNLIQKHNDKILPISMTSVLAYHMLKK